MITDNEIRHVIEMALPPDNCKTKNAAVLVNRAWLFKKIKQYLDRAKTEEFEPISTNNLPTGTSERQPM